MNQTKTVIAASAVMLLFAIASTARADNCGGRYNNFGVMFESVEVVKGYTLATATNKHAVTSDNSPYTGIGHCSNIMLTMPDGKTKITYTCIEKDKDGDSWTHSGTLEPGASKGTWTQVAGTGKFAGKIGSGGWWQGVMSEGAVITGTWGGNCK